jgi:hypothetical protein
LDPDDAFISCGTNTYGHPDQVVLDRLKATANVYLTNLCDETRNYSGTTIVNGDIVICSTDGSTYNVLCERRVYLPFVVDNSSPDPTPTPTEPPPPATTGKVEIRNIFYDGAGSSEPDEYVEIENDDSFPIQLKNWTLRDEANHLFTFPSFVIQPNQTCRVYTNQVHPQWCGFSYGSGSAIWNNSGDTATLRDGIGTLIDDYSY